MATTKWKGWMAEALESVARRPLVAKSRPLKGAQCQCTRRAFMWSIPNSDIYLSPTVYTTCSGHWWGEFKNDISGMTTFTSPKSHNWKGSEVDLSPKCVGIQSWSSYHNAWLPVSFNLMAALILHPHWAHMLLIISLYHSHIIGVPDWNNCIILLNLSNLTNGARMIGRGFYSLHLLALILWLP